LSGLPPSSPSAEGNGARGFGKGGAPVIKGRAIKHLFRLGRLVCSSCGTTLATGGAVLERQARLDEPDLCRGCWLAQHGLDPGNTTVSRRRRGG